MSNVNIYEFIAHENLLRQVIFSQAGNREKAILEGVMNSIDAGATFVDIMLTAQDLVIQDDGRGFQSAEEINTNFRQFGLPHEDGDAVFGKYRMGRGQLFSFGVNEWRSRQFCMRVDAKQAIRYELEEGLPDVAGCRVQVQWYEKLYPQSLAHIERELGAYFKYVDLPVRVNGIDVTRNPKKESWDIVTDQYYIRVKPRGAVAVYNLGAFVRDYPARQFGVGGVVVSRVRLDVNFARNDIREDDKVWKRIQKELRKHTIDDTTKTNRRPMLDDEREFWWQQIGDPTYVPDNEYELHSLKLFVDVTGRPYSYRDLLRQHSRTGLNVLTVASANDATADRLQQAGAAFALRDDVLEQGGFTSPKQLMNRLQAVGLELPFQFKEMKTMIRGFTKYTTVQESNWTAQETAVVGLLRGGAWAHRELREACGARERRIGVGHATGADAWTDGQTYIMIDREFLKRVGMGVEGWMQLAFLLLHEYLHNDSTETRHVHGADFFQRYHDLTDHAIRLGWAFAVAWTKQASTRTKRLRREAVKLAEVMERLADRSKDHTQAASIKGKLLVLQKALKRGL